MISEPTETTEVTEAAPPGRGAFRIHPQVRPDRSAVSKRALPEVPFRGWIFYDRDCGFCRKLALRFENVFAKRGFHFESLQNEWVQRRLDLTREQALEEMRVLTRAGDIFAGADAVIFLFRQLWWATPLAVLGRLQFGRAMLDRLYRWVAAHRSCAINPAHTPAIPARTRWIAIAILPLVALSAKPFVAAWVFMWLMAVAIFFGCKWLTLGNAIGPRGHVRWSRAAGYLVAWPGMSAPRFLSPNPAPECSRIEIVKTVGAGIARMLLGLLLVFVVARRAADPLFAGWIGMVGLVLILHFGLFALASIGWKALRVDAPPIMDRPLRSTSVSEFWGRRWNGAFNDLALRLLFRPVARVTGPAVGILVAFAVSGLIHELVISLPAGAGFGLPTGYFLLQGFGILAERSSIGSRFGLGAGISGWLFTMMIVAGPAFWLFHPPFVRSVILPFLRTIGAL